MNQGKLEVVKQEMARVNVNILGISDLKWTGMGEFNSGDHYIYYCGQESRFPGGSGCKESACHAGDLGLIPGLGRSSGGGHGNPLQYSYLENTHDRGAWQATVHGVAKSRTRLSTA